MTTYKKRNTKYKTQVKHKKTPKNRTRKMGGGDVCDTIMKTLKITRPTPLQKIQYCLFDTMKEIVLPFSILSVNTTYDSIVEAYDLNVKAIPPPTKTNTLTARLITKMSDNNNKMLFIDLVIIHDMLVTTENQKVRETYNKILEALQALQRNIKPKPIVKQPIAENYIVYIKKQN
jgi:hypothetical protein